MTVPLKNKIRVYRAVYDITQEALAKELGITRQTLIAIEKNRYSPSLELAFKIARHFGVGVEDVFEYEEES
jgi:putative transcriptional regulator